MHYPGLPPLLLFVHGWHKIVVLNRLQTKLASGDWRLIDQRAPKSSFIKKRLVSLETYSKMSFPPIVCLMKKDAITSEMLSQIPAVMGNSFAQRGCRDCELFRHEHTNLCQKNTRDQDVRTCVNQRRKLWATVPAENQRVYIRLHDVALSVPMDHDKTEKQKKTQTGFFTLGRPGAFLYVGVSVLWTMMKGKQNRAIRGRPRYSYNWDGDEAQSVAKKHWSISQKRDGCFHCPFSWG